jgi:hypothetical protein
MGNQLTQVISYILQTERLGQVMIWTSTQVSTRWVLFMAIILGLITIFKFHQINHDLIISLILTDTCQVEVKHRLLRAKTALQLWTCKLFIICKISKPWTRFTSITTRWLLNRVTLPNGPQSFIQSKQMTCKKVLKNLS